MALLLAYSKYGLTRLAVRAADMAQLKALLARRTLHSTWPNIIVGSRSIGGADDLDRLIESGEFAEMLDEVGVRMR